MQTDKIEETDRWLGEDPDAKKTRLQICKALTVSVFKKRWLTKQNENCTRVLSSDVEDDIVHSVYCRQDTDVPRALSRCSLRTKVCKAQVLP